MKEVKIKTADKNGKNVVNIILRVNERGQIREMFGVGERRKKREVKQIKFTLAPVAPEDPDNDECKCCSIQNGQIVCVTCACEG